MFIIEPGIEKWRGGDAEATLALLAKETTPRSSALFRVIITLLVPGSGTWEFESGAMDNEFAKVLVWSLADGGPFTIQSARKVRDEG